MKEKKHEEKEQKNKQNENKIKSEEDTQQEIGELKDLLQRTHAEFQNYRRRVEDDKKNFTKLANEQLIKKTLPILDNIQLALEHTKEKNDFTKGIELIYSQLLETLEQEGLQKISATGKFNPNLHEAILTEESTNKPGIIIQELQKGYMLGDRVIRHSKVKIAKKQTQTEVEKNE